MPERTYKRKRYIVRRGFQLKYAALILGVALLSALISGYTIFYNSWVLLGEKLANVYPQGQLVGILKTVNMKLAINMFFVLVLCAAVGVIASHRIAGPIYRMISFLDNVAKGDYAKRITLRKGDELVDLASAINRLVDKLETEKKP